MSRVQPQSLGDAYPALCNFLRLISLTLAAPQLALTVYVGDDWSHGGVINYGHLPAAILREVLSSQPVQGPSLDCGPLSLSTYGRSNRASNTVLVGHLRSARNRYNLAVYVPGQALDCLNEVQVKTLQYLSQQMLLCLSLAHPVDPGPQPAAALHPQPSVPPAGPNFLSQVVAINTTSPTSDRLHQGHPRLVDLVVHLQACLSYQQLGEHLATYLPYFFPHKSGRLVLFSNSSETVSVLTEWGEATPLTALEQHCCYAKLQRDWSSETSQECRQCQVTFGLAPWIKCIVLGTIDDTICIVQLVLRETEPFSPVQTALLKKLSEQILFVMQRLRLLEDLQNQAMKDPLTGLLNRRHADTVLNSLCHAANRQQNISIILIDIDYFKAVNDTYGHQAGDAVLKNMGMLLRGHVRTQDIVYRYGGEEFCMVLLDTTPEVALRRAEKIRRAVKYVNNSFNGQVLPPVTISLGVASFPDDGETPQALVTLADKALYWAKSHGRDRAVSVDHMRSRLEYP